MERRRFGMWVRFALLVALLLAGLLVTLRFGVPDLDAVSAQVQSLGSGGVVIFIALYAASTLLVLPKGVLSAAAGLVYGFWPAVAIVIAAAMTGALLAFVIGRLLGRDAVQQMAGGHLVRLDALIVRFGVAAIVLVRLIPVIPFTVINYISGLTSISTGAYTLGTLIGILPGTAAYVALGAYGRQPGSWEFMAAAGAFALLSLAGIAFWLRRRVPEPAPTHERAS
ncbi:MAG: TVP38/TMEM64 family protein [Actinomycetota bacterium]|nr:TVP38/TMEM64 family protein [Actinomycetota bacterium]